MRARGSRQRPLIAFFDWGDVFEDFYPHYGVDQQTFATRWDASANHAFLSLLQREVGDVIWYTLSLAPELAEAQHEGVGCRMKFFRSSRLHRQLWRAFYLPPFAWRWQGAYPAYATVASYLALASVPFIAALFHDRPDFFFLQDYATGRFDVLTLLAGLCGARLCAFHAGSLPQWHQARHLKRWTIPRAHRLLVTSQDEANMLARRYGVSRERLRVVLTPIDTAAFRPLDRDGSCQAAGLEAARRYLLFVGRLDDRVKRVSAVIRSFAGLADQHESIDLAVVGEGPDSADLRSLAEQLVPGRVRFLGWVSEVERKVRLYNAADCLLLPSRSEGFPTVVGEAMACGTPVIASRVGGVSELVVDGRTGWLVPPGDDAALAATLSYALAHQDGLHGMRAHARRVAEQRVSPTVVATALRECFSRDVAAHD